MTIVIQNTYYLKQLLNHSLKPNMWTRVRQDRVKHFLALSLTWVFCGHAPLYYQLVTSSDIPTDTCDMRVWPAFVIDFQLTCKSPLKPATVNPLKKIRLFNKLYGVAIRLEMIMCMFFYIIIHIGRLLLLQGQKKSLIKKPINDAPSLTSPPRLPPPTRTPVWSVTFPI